jgi:CBS domain-containing protein
MKLLDILNMKGRTVFTAHPEDSVLQVVQTLIAHKVGALAIVDEAGLLVGIISERDILRLSGTDCGSFRNMAVSDYMTRDLVVADSSMTVEESLSIMTERRIRHLPVVENGKLSGIISQGDLVKALLEDARHEARQLTGFVTGQYPT